MKFSLHSRRSFWSAPIFDAHEYLHRRNALIKLLPKDSIAVVPAYRLLYSSQNIFYRFHQNRNLEYMTGYSAPNACAIISNHGDINEDGKCHLTMFAEGEDQHSRTWTGPKLTPEVCKQVYQADAAYPFEELSIFLKQMISDGKRIYTDHSPNNDCLDVECNSILSTAVNLKPFLQQLRVIKSTQELSIMSAGCKLSAESLQTMIEWTQHNKIKEERQLASRMEFECKQRGADDLAYVPVVASGSRALILHYTHNNQTIDASKMVLVDAGALYKGYCSDISRTFAPTGSRSESQRLIYETVLAVQAACINIIANRHLLSHKSISLDELHGASCLLFMEHLKELGFKGIDKLLDTVYPHHIGHYIGMDVHDCPAVSTSLPLQPGMVITVEPGLYIPIGDSRFPEQFWGIGVRIEDDVAVTEDGCHVLTSAVSK